MSDPISLRDYVDGRFKEQDGRLTALEGRIATAMTDQAHATEKSIDRLTAVLGEINTRILEVEKALAGIKAQLGMAAAIWSIVLIVLSTLVNKWLGG